MDPNESGISKAGGAAVVRGGTAVFDRCLMRQNRGELAQALFVYQDAAAFVHDCVIVGNSGPAAITASWGAKVTVELSTVVAKGGAALRAVGTGASAPTIMAERCVLGGTPPIEMLRGGAPQPVVDLTHNFLSSPPAGDGVVERESVVGPMSGAMPAGYGASWK